jgi:predicted XRE-type DNA-binding protein
MNNLELFNNFWQDLESYKNEEEKLEIFANHLIANKPSILEHVSKRKIVLFLKKINYKDVNYCCWEWGAFKDKDGYGSFSIKDNPNVSRRSHRIIQFLTDLNFDLDSELQACHSCDNPSCCNPNHLWSGTTQDNTQDKYIKGRSASGSNHGQGKLIDDQVLAIFNDPRTLEVIAKEYNVSKVAISRIKSGKRKLTDQSIILPKNKNLQGNNVKLTRDDVIEIQKLYATNQYYQWELADKFNVAQSAISNIINGKSLKRFQ